MPYSDIQKRKECTKRYRETHRDEIRAVERKYYRDHEEKFLGYRRSRRTLVLQHYGGKCTCCGEGHYEFLAMDHINGGGNKHRKQVGSSVTFYRWLIKQNFPVEYQVLCHNCNMAKGFYGECPHLSLVREVGGMA